MSSSSTTPALPRPQPRPRSHFHRRRRLTGTRARKIRPPRRVRPPGPKIVPNVSTSNPPPSSSPERPLPSSWRSSSLQLLVHLRTLESQLIDSSRSSSEPIASLLSIFEKALPKAFHSTGYDECFTLIGRLLGPLIFSPSTGLPYILLHESDSSPPTSTHEPISGSGSHRRPGGGGGTTTTTTGGHSQPDSARSSISTPRDVPLTPTRRERERERVRVISQFESLVLDLKHRNSILEMELKKAQEATKREKRTAESAFGELRDRLRRKEDRIGELEDLIRDSGRRVPEEVESTSTRNRLGMASHRHRHGLSIDESSHDILDLKETVESFISRLSEDGGSRPVNLFSDPFAQMETLRRIHLQLELILNQHVESYMHQDSSLGSISADQRKDPSERLRARTRFVREVNLLTSQMSVIREKMKRIVAHATSDPDESDDRSSTRSRSGKKGRLPRRNASALASAPSLLGLGLEELDLDLDEEEEEEEEEESQQQLGLLHVGMELVPPSVERIRESQGTLPRRKTSEQKRRNTTFDLSRFRGSAPLERLNPLFFDNTIDLFVSERLFGENVFGGSPAAQGPRFRLLHRQVLSPAHFKPIVIELPRNAESLKLVHSRYRHIPTLIDGPTDPTRNWNVLLPTALRNEVVELKTVPERPIWHFYANLYGETAIPAAARSISLRHLRSVMLESYVIEIRECVKPAKLRRSLVDVLYNYINDTYILKQVVMKVFYEVILAVQKFTDLHKETRRRSSPDLDGETYLDVAYFHDALVGEVAPSWGRAMCLAWRLIENACARFGARHTEKVLRFVYQGVSDQEIRVYLQEALNWQHSPRESAPVSTDPSILHWSKNKILHFLFSTMKKGSELFASRFSGYILKSFDRVQLYKHEFEKALRLFLPDASYNEMIGCFESLQARLQGHQVDVLQLSRVYASAKFETRWRKGTVQ